MSRLGKLPIDLPQGVTVTMQGRKITVKGPKATLSRELHETIVVHVEDNKVQVALAAGAEEAGNMHGLWRQLINNMVIGVHQPYEKILELIGVGYRAAVQGKEIDLQLGYSHPTRVAIPEGIDVKVEKNTVIQILGADKQKVGQFAADIRAYKPPEPYKGKGIRHRGEFVRKKAGKSAKKQ